jgi:hypothetical protein
MRIEKVIESPLAIQEEIKAIQEAKIAQMRAHQERMEALMNVSLEKKKAWLGKTAATIRASQE